MKWPVFDHPEVFHIGTLDSSQKGTTHNAHSHEGNGLSVSLEPEAWKSIARLGGHPTWHLSFKEEASSGNGAAKFVDVHSMKDQHWNEVITWAGKEGLVEPTDLIVISWYDSEVDNTLCMKFDASTQTGKDNAYAEFEDKEEASMAMEKGWKPTQAMNDRIGFKVDPLSTNDMALTLYVEDVLFPSQQILGVWWNEELDPSILSAPRGVITPLAVDSWVKEVANPSQALRIDTVPGFERALGEFKDELYSQIYAIGDCGPFDGGCVVFAQALKDVIGGDIVVICRPNGSADHAGVYRDGKIYDMDGPLRPDDFMDRFARNESTVISSWRDIEDGDLVEAVRDVNLQRTLTELLQDALGDELKLTKTRSNARHAMAFIEEVVEHGSKSKPTP